MTARVCIAIPPLIGATFLACGGTIYSEGPEPVDAAADGKTDSPWTDAGHDGSKPQPDAGKDAFDEYVDPGCPNPPETILDFQCDPLVPPPGSCDEGQACYPYVSYPSGPCEAEVYGAHCRTAGTQTQGEPCGSLHDCAGGFVCVVSGSGSQCVRLCSLTDPSTCPHGQICKPLDVAGIGGCL